MNKEMLDDLLKAMINMSDEVEDLRASGSHLDELYADIEIKVNDVGLGLNGLQQNIRKLDRKVAMLSNELVRMRTRPIIHKAVN